MTLKPMPHFILVRCNIKEQKERKEKTGMFYTHPDHQFMIFNMEWGEIVGIGKKAQEQFPEAKVGHTLIFHHFVQGIDKTDSKKNHLIYEDEEYYYYVVTTSKFNGKRNETYGVWDGEKIIPHPEFVFLEVERPKESYADNEDFTNAALAKSKGGLLLFKEWKTTREDRIKKMSELKKQNENLSITGLNNPQVRVAILRNEEEMAKLNEQNSRVEYLPYTISYANKLLSQWFDTPIKSGQILFMDNRGAEKIINFKGKEYRVGICEYIGYMPNPLWDCKKISAS